MDTEFIHLIPLLEQAKELDEDDKVWTWTRRPILSRNN